MSNWEKVKLGDVVTLLNGRAYKQDELLDKGDTPVLRVGNFFSNRGWYYSDLQLEENKYCNKGDLLYAWSASFGPMIWDGPRAIYHYHIWKIVLSEHVEKGYMYHLLQQSTKTIKEQGRGIAMIHATKSGMEKMLIPLPPLETQKKIAKTLDTAAELLAMRKQQLAELDNLMNSTFYDMFGDPFGNPKGWNMCQLSDLAVIIMGQSPNGSSYNEEGEGTPLLNGPSEFREKYPKEKQWTLEPTKMCQKDDILFCVRGATAGRMNISDKEYCIGRGLAAIRPKQYSMQGFIYLYLKMMYNHFQVTSNGSTFINISKDQLHKLPYLKVDTELQDKFSNIYLKIEEQKALVKISIDETQHLFDSLMSEYFE